MFFKSLVQYYDLLYNDIQSDLSTKFQSNLSTLLNMMSVLIVIATTFLAMGIALSWIVGASTPFAGLASPFLSIFMTIFGVLITLVTGSAAVVVLFNFTRFLVLLVIVIMWSMFIVGIVMIVIPSSFSVRIGEEIIGAVVMFFLVFPLIGAFSFAFYHFLMDSTLNQLQSLPPFPLVGPILQPIVQIMTFITSTSVVSIFIIGALVLILQRVGVGLGIGEAFSYLIWR
ncbi:MAG: hypothetical protein ACP5IZ_11340 [Thermoprotei archaeon]